MINYVSITSDFLTDFTNIFNFSQSEHTIGISSTFTINEKRVITLLLLPFLKFQFNTLSISNTRF